jgi:hypothetical protein
LETEAVSTEIYEYPQLAQLEHVHHILTLIYSRIFMGFKLKFSQRAIKQKQIAIHFPTGSHLSSLLWKLQSLINENEQLESKEETNQLTNGCDAVGYEQIK